MALTTTEVSKLYVLTLGRASEGVGNTFWQDGDDLASTAEAMLNFTESSNYFGDSLNDNRTFIEYVYENSFGKSPSDDVNGINYWVDSLESGITRGEVIAAIIEASQESVNSGSAQDMFNNKALVSNYIAQNIENADINNLDIFAKYIEDVTSESSTVQVAYDMADIDIIALGKIPVNPNNISGIVSDGYITGATVFADSNGDGVWNEGEAQATTDASGNFSLVGATGSIIASGGTDISTGIAFEGVFSAPEGSTTVSPLTTLIDQVIQGAVDKSGVALTADEAAAQVASALGIDESVDLLSFDPIAASSDDTLSEAAQAAAIATQAAAVQVVNMMSQAAAMMSGAGIASESKGAIAAAASLATMISDAASAPAGTVIDFGSATVVELFLQDAAVEAGASVEQVAAVEAVSSVIADATANINTVMSDAVDNAAAGTSVADIFTQLAQTQVAAEAIEDLAASAAESGDVSAVEEAADTDAITTASEEAAGDVAEAAADAEAAQEAEEENSSQDEVVTPVVNPNHAPTVESALTSEATEGSAAYTINLLQGASDIDSNSVLSIGAVVEANSESGWSVDGNILTINPASYGELSSNDLKALNFTYDIHDQYGAKINQSLSVNIQGTDAPSLNVITSAADLVNKINLTINAQPDIDERIALTFVNLPTNATVLDNLGNDITSGISNFSGTGTFSVVLPSDENFNDDISVIVTGYDSSSQEIAHVSKDIAMAYEVSSTVQNLNFTSLDQSIWDDSIQTTLIDWHQYIPVIGGVSQTWNDSTQSWDGVANSEVWDSGLIHVLDVEFDSQKLTDDISQAANKLLDDAQLIFDRASVAVDETALSTLNTARADFESALESVDSGVQDTFDAAKTTFENAKDAYANAKVVFEAIEDNFLGPQTDLLDNIRQTKTDAWYDYVDSREDYYDSAYTVWGVTYHDPVKYAIKIADYAIYKTARAAYDAALIIYDAQESIYDVAKDTWDDAKDAFEVTATNIFNDAKSTYEDSIAVLNDAALSTFRAAETTYEAVKQAIFDAAQSVLDVAAAANTATMTALDKVDFNNQVKLDTQLKAQVGFKIDFELNSGSVNTDLDYTLTSSNQYNKTTDTLTITPTMININGGDVTYTTVSPNSKFIVTLVSDVESDIDLYLDGHLVVDNTSIYDLSPNSESLHISETLSTSSHKSTYDGLSQEDKNEIGSDGSEVVLINYDSTDEDVGLDAALNLLLKYTTKGAATVELHNPNISTQGTEATYEQSYFEEGGLVNVDFSEINNIIVNLVTEKVDYTDEIKALYGLSSINDQTLHEVISTSAAVLTETLLDSLDGQSDAVAMFIVDTTDETTTSLFHINSFADDLSTLDADTANFGFYTSYGESEPVIKTTIDIDRTAAVIVNYIVKAAAVASGVGATVAGAIPVINPFDLSLNMSKILEVTHLDNTQAAQYLDFAVAFETLDIDVSGEVGYSQEFSLSIDDMSYLITLEDGTTRDFKANEYDNITIENISSYDENGDGNIEYTIGVVPTAMFSNDTEIGHSLGYSMEFLQNSLSTGFEIPVDELLGNLLSEDILNLLPDIDISLLDLNFGPLFTVEGDLDTLDIDVFENRFDLDVGSATSNIQIVGISEDTMFVV